MALNYAMQSEVLPVYANLPKNKVLAVVVLLLQVIPFVSLGATTVGISLYLDRDRDVKRAKDLGVPLVLCGMLGLVVTFLAVGFVFRR